MYRHCIFCSADLGANEAVKEFPVGRTLAFDGARGRLWAVCARCARWNLAPLEERWEPIERAERSFHDARLRAQGENVGLARLPDGTRLIRVGRAPPAELAAWRYGEELVRRRERGRRADRRVEVGGLLLGLVGMLAWPVTLPLAGIGAAARRVWVRRRVIARVPAADSPTGAELLVRRKNLDGLRAVPGGDGSVCLELPRAPAPGVDPSRPLVLDGAPATHVLSRVLPLVNATGAAQPQVQAALDLLGSRGGPDAYVRELARAGVLLGIGRTVPAGVPRSSLRWIHVEGSLALEMALHEEQERRALEGELALLEAAWREAEEIAAIADRLPGAAPARTGPAGG